MIEEWLTNEALAECRGVAVGSQNGLLFNSNIQPYLDMTLKGWAFYQGENNVATLHGNSGTADQPSSGYACMMPQLVQQVRSAWSRVPNTTAANAPFGLVGLSPHDSEGADDMASFRWAQQASLGAVPNARMPDCFMAHAFDLQDPWSGNTGSCLSDELLPQYDCRTPWFMSPGIHPRLKRPVGQRLAMGALRTAYGAGGGVQGGAVVGCSLSPGGRGAWSLEVRFGMAAGRALLLRLYNASDPVASAFSVEVNGTDWRPVLATPGQSPNSVSLSLPASSDATNISPTTAPVTAVRYAWGATDPGGQGPVAPNGKDISCCQGDGVQRPCVPVQCPLLAAEPAAPFGGLPLAPFIAKIVDNKCLCPEPQICDQ